MNPHQKPQEDVVVTQEDRLAALAMRHVIAGQLRRVGINIDVMSPADDSPEVQAFARHRLLAYEAGRRDMREAAGKVAVAHMGDCQDVLKAIGAEQTGRHVLNAELGPMGAVEVKMYRGRNGQRMALESSNGGASLFALPAEPLGGEGKP